VTVMTSTDPQVSRLRGALDRQIEADKQFAEKSKATLDPSSPPPPQLRPAASPPLSPSTIPEAFEDRYAKGWSDALGLIMPQLYELHRRSILRGRAASDHWVKWLPIICFSCTLFGFLLGWYGKNALGR
jgi:hypothetical protein